MILTPCYSFLKVGMRNLGRGEYLVEKGKEKCLLGMGHFSLEFPVSLS